MDKNHSHIYSSLRRAAALLCAALLFAGCGGCPASKADSPAAGSGTASISASTQADGSASASSAADSDAGTYGKATQPAGMVIRDGMATQIVRYSDAQDLQYSNEGSEILRFCVFVETDHDTDQDGRPDLIKTIVQLPRPAAEGSYKAPVIYEARPYIAGMYGFTPNLKEVGTAEFDESVLYAEPEKRIPEGTISTLDLAAAADPADWFYTLDSDPFAQQYLGNFTTYDDLLVCGFAIVQSAGLGTLGSEGIECCTSDLEAEAFACVIDWLCGRRNAYSDLSGNIQVDADWCNRRIGMTGRSYAGAMAVEIASLGTEGLETIVPVAAPASWYDYTNSQGILSGLYSIYDFAADLAASCASRMMTSGQDPELLERYRSYLSWLRDEQVRADGDYNEFWQNRDYLQSDSFQTSALIVQGLHDVVVHPKQFDLLRNALLRCGCEVKCLLHQNGHVTPANEQTRTDILIGNHTYTELLNLWFTHYLLDADNAVGQMAPFTVQSNVDGSFYETDSWNDGEILELSADGAAVSTGNNLNSGDSAEILDAEGNAAANPVTDNAATGDAATDDAAMEDAATGDSATDDAAMDDAATSDASTGDSATGDAGEYEFTVSAADAHLANQTLLTDTFDGGSASDHLLLASMTADRDLTIAGIPQLQLRVKTPDPTHHFPMLAAVLVDAADEPFGCYDVEWSEVLDQEILEADAVYRGDGVMPYSLASWKQKQNTRQVITYGSMDLRNPEAGYEPETAAAPASPIKADQYYTYTLYLQPSFYTLKEGHHLELYVVPYCGFSVDSAFYDTETEDSLRELGFDPAAMIPVTRDYSFTVDIAKSFAHLPLLK